MRYGVLALLVAVVAGCDGGGSSGEPPPVLSDPLITMYPSAGGWTGNLVEDNLGSVSNNGFGYTGEIDRFDLTVPADGRLQIALVWTHAADFDLIVSSDPLGKQRLAVGAEGSNLSEYVGLDVIQGQRLYLLVAGWVGEPGDYSIETLILPPGTPLFAVEELPEIATPQAANGPLVVRFNKELDPRQDPHDRIFLIATGHVARGTWCIQGHELKFFPELPEVAGETNGLLPFQGYSLQIPRGPTGLRAVTGEYLDELVLGSFDTGPLIDEVPGEPPRVLDLDWPVSAPWNGVPLNLTLSEAIDPDTLEVTLSELGGISGELPVPIRFTLSQSRHCVDERITRIQIALDAPLPPAATLRLRVPGSVRGIDGDPAPEQGLTGPPPAPGGGGFTVDLHTP